MRAAAPAALLPPGTALSSFLPPERAAFLALFRATRSLSSLTPFSASPAGPDCLCLSLCFLDWRWLLKELSVEKCLLQREQ